MRQEIDWSLKYVPHENGGMVMFCYDGVPLFLWQRETHVVDPGLDEKFENCPQAYKFLEMLNENRIDPAMWR